LLDATQEVVERMTEKALAQACEVQVSSHGDVRGVWDRVRVEQVLTNLLDNALRHGAGRPVSIRIERRESSALIVVEDEGRGIAKADLARIFERFERAAGQRGRDGLGMGLYIARQIVEAHGGSILAKSEVNRGAAFHVILPLSATPPNLPAEA
jgi:signal transduction histidine kinase